MAAEFIGARISLISKSSIRYSGVLHSIDPANATVSLEKVRSHGTEGRKGGAGEIAPNDNVYEFIVFRASDVADLQIDAPAPDKAEDAPPTLDDPAIVGQAQSRPPPPPQQQQQPWQQQQQRGPYPPGPPYGMMPPPPPHHFGPPPFPHPHHHHPNNVPFLSPPPPPPQQQQQQQPFPQSQPSPVPTPSTTVTAESTDGDQQKKKEMLPAAPAKMAASDSTPAEPVVASSATATKPAGAQPATQQPPRQQQHQQQQQQRAGKIEIPSTEFDFEQANRKFEKLSLNQSKGQDGDAGEAEEGEIIVIPSGTTTTTTTTDIGGSSMTYDKKSSFFDSISSDLMSRAEGKQERFDRNAERSRNLDTFGEAGSNNHRRGGGRGRGGRGGGGRGGRGGRGMRGGQGQRGGRGGPAAQ